MSSKINKATIQIRRDTAANWTSNNPTPKQGEWCLEKDTGYTKQGDGTTAWNSLEYSTNMVFGSFWGNDIGWTQVAVQNTWYNIVDAAISDGELNKVTHDGNGLLTVSEAGRYKIDYSASVESSAQNKHIEIGIEISSSGAAEDCGIQHVHVPNVAAIASTEFAVSSIAIIDLAVDDTVEVTVRTTDTGTPTITVDHINMTIVQIYKTIV